MSSCLECSGKGTERSPNERKWDGRMKRIMCFIQFHSLYMMKERMKRVNWIKDTHYIPISNITPSFPGFSSLILRYVSLFITGHKEETPWKWGKDCSEEWNDERNSFFIMSLFYLHSFLIIPKITEHELVRECEEMVVKNYEEKPLLISHIFSPNFISSNNNLSFLCYL